MKLNKMLLSLGVSLFSTMVLGGLSTQQVKADDVAQQSSPTVDNSQNPTTNKEPSENSSMVQAGSGISDGNETSASEISQVQAQPSTYSTEAAPQSDTDSQAVNISFTDDSGNPVKDSTGNEYTFNSSYEVGSNTVDDIQNDSNLADGFLSAYTIDSDENSKIIKDQSNYNLKVTAKSFNLTAHIADIGYTSNKSVKSKVGQPTIIPDNNDLTKYEKKGFGFSCLTDNKGKQISDNGSVKVTLTFDMLPNLGTSATGYLIEAKYSTPLTQPLIVNLIDDEGKSINTKYFENDSNIKTGDIISNVSSVVSDSDIDSNTYAYWKSDLPCTISGPTSSEIIGQNTDPFVNNVINVYYTHKDVDYFKVNYYEATVGKNDVIYTDYLRPENGEVTIKNINNINLAYRIDSSNTVSLDSSYNIGDDSEVYIPVTSKSKYTLKQVSDGKTFESTQTYDAAKASNNYDVKDIFLGDMSVDPNGEFNLDVYVSGISDGSMVNEQWNGNFDKSKTLEQNVAELLPNIFQLDDPTFTIIYKDKDLSVPSNIIYKDPNGKTIGKPISIDKTGDTIDLSSLVTDNKPSGADFVNTDNPFSIVKNSDGTISVIATMTSSGDNNNNGNSNNGSSTGGGSSSSNDDDENTGSTESIDSTISIHPSQSPVIIYDDNGDKTDLTIPASTDWVTDKKMTLAGKTYYRIATNQWINAEDIYTYSEDPEYVRTYSDSYKKIITSRENTITNRALASGSDWASDRYTYFDNQKYYRVATNEWISANDSFKYQPIDQIIQTTPNSQLFDDRGNFVRTISSLTLKTDKVATINGIKMYRVATNEWLPVNNVR
ncbi:SLAP domain-containing protein [Companilactobacillus musae]|uniref:SLAP domain-containing protein n=1 Tax=Companilactobacillus musae TaxID=1903258 RepID=UPI000E65CDCE|nr:SLAP domain-containing protein [Companilactobacillus musae]